MSPIIRILFIYCLISIIYANDIIEILDEASLRQLLSGRLGTKTPYRDWQHNSDVHVDRDRCEFPEEQKCKATYLYQVIRHGTRYPTEKHIVKMEKLVRELNHSEFVTDFIKHKKDASLLCPEGIQEQYQLGVRTRQYLNELFSETYHPSRYEFSSSQVTRALQSSMSFVHGLFPDTLERQSVAISSETKSYDTQLRFHKACEAYSRQVKKNTTLKEQGPVALLGDAIYPKVFQSIVARGMNLGIDLSAYTPSKLVPIVWDICMMEYATWHQISKFCYLLSKEDIHLLEYYDDVTSYWLKGYGFSINYEMSCLLFGDIVGSLSRAKSSDMLRATFRFAHAETLIPLLARFGLFHDSPDKFDELSDLAQDRTWNTGTIVPFSANIAVVLYTCDSAAAAQQDKEFIRVFHNERPVTLPRTLCPETANNDVTQCSLNVFLSAVSSVIDSCDFEKICQHDEKLDS